MCKCNPSVRTPFCGNRGCEWPKSENKVVPFIKPETDLVYSEQTGFGLAFCLHCKHEWQAVAPTGTTKLECPACLTMKGKYKFEFQPETRRVCQCENDLFHLTPEGHLCPNCGIYQRYE